jgi:hypothetical protein
MVVNTPFGIVFPCLHPTNKSVLILVLFDEIKCFDSNFESCYALGYIHA